MKGSPYFSFYRRWKDSPGQKASRNGKTLCYVNVHFTNQIASPTFRELQQLYLSVHLRVCA